MKLGEIENMMRESFDTINDLRERLAEAVRVMDETHGYACLCSTDHVSPSCKIAAFLAQEKEKG